MKLKKKYPKLIINDIDKFNFVNLNVQGRGISLSTKWPCGQLVKSRYGLHNSTQGAKI